MKKRRVLDEVPAAVVAKRARARVWRIEQITRVLNAHGIATAHGSDQPDAIAIANEIDDALHPDMPGVCGPYPKDR